MRENTGRRSSADLGQASRQFRGNTSGTEMHDWKLKEQQPRRVLHQPLKQAVPCPRSSVDAVKHLLARRAFIYTNGAGPSHHMHRSRYQNTSIAPLSHHLLRCNGLARRLRARKEKLRLCAFHCILPDTALGFRLVGTQVLGRRLLAGRRERHGGGLGLSFRAHNCRSE